MIKNQDRSKWFGASDTAMIMGNWKTQTFVNWWMQKLALLKNDYKNKAMLAGTNYEHKIAHAISEYLGKSLILDRQIKIWNLRLRVNLDSETKKAIYEIKTYNEQKTFKLPRNYVSQVRVQMWATGKEGYIVAYPMSEECYRNYFLPIDKEKLEFYKVEQDENFITEYLKRLKILKRFLIRGRFPVIEQVK